MQVTLASRPSPDASSNEDFIAATTSVVVVVDGASVPTGLVTGCVHGTAWFARRLGIEVLAVLITEADHSPADSLAQAISQVAALLEANHQDQPAVVADGQLAVAGGDGPVLLEPGRYSARRHYAADSAPDR